MSSWKNNCCITVGVSNDATYQVARTIDALEIVLVLMSIVSSSFLVFSQTAWNNLTETIKSSSMLDIF